MIRQLWTTLRVDAPQIHRRRDKKILVILGGHDLAFSATPYWPRNTCRRKQQRFVASVICTAKQPKRIATAESTSLNHVTCTNVPVNKMSNEVGCTATVPANGLFTSTMKNIVAIKKAAKTPYSNRLRRPFNRPM